MANSGDKWYPNVMHGYETVGSPRQLYIEDALNSVWNIGLTIISLISRTSKTRKIHLNHQP